jgi:hypothetical protein
LYSSIYRGTSRDEQVSLRVVLTRLSAALMHDALREVIFPLIEYNRHQMFGKEELFGRGSLQRQRCAPGPLERGIGWDHSGRTFEHSCFLVGCASSLPVRPLPIRKQQQPAPRLIHNRPGLVGCENAWDRYATSQRHAGPEKRRLWVSRELRPIDSSAYRLSFRRHRSEYGPPSDLRACS